MDIPKIPKRFHFIWLGPKPLPASSEANIVLWRKLHPDWQVDLWSDASIRSDASIQKFLEKSAGWRNAALLSTLESYAAKSDVLRLLLLREFGGVYLDGDMEPVRPLDPIIDGIELVGESCFVGWEQTGDRINNAVIGAAPGHPAVCDALDNLPGHLSEHWQRDRHNAAALTGPFYLNEIWKDDSRVVKYPKEVFYPYDWHEPWKQDDASIVSGPDTFAVHRWDACWIDETRTPQVPLARKIAIVVLGQTDLVREALVWGSHLGQSVNQESRIYVPGEKTPGSLYGNLYNIAARQSGKCDRILFVPADHVLDRNMIETHALLPASTVGITPPRLFSAEKLFENKRKANTFPFEVFKFHGWEAGKGHRITGTWQDVCEVFSATRPMVEMMATLPDEHGLKDSKDWFDFARRFVAGALEMGERAAFTYKTRTTKLCLHPVNEKISAKAIL